MKLENFEEFVASKIINRGRDYYESGYVEAIEEVCDGEFSATILGTEDYNVFIALDHQKVVTEHFCDCPYDWSDVCKHKVAVLFHLREAAPFVRPVTHRSVQELKRCLNDLSKDALLELMVNISKRNKNFREALFEELEG